jgi:hypothetical protein
MLEQPGGLVIRHGSALGRMILDPVGRSLLADGRVVHPGLVSQQAIQDGQEEISSRLVANRMR